MLFLSSQDMLLSLYNVNSISSGSHPSSTPSPLNQVAGPVLGWRWARALGLHACPPPGNRDCPRKRLPPALAFCWHDFKRGRSPGVVVGWDLRPEGLTALFFLLLLLHLESHPLNEARIDEAESEEGAGGNPGTSLGSTWIWLWLRPILSFPFFFSLPSSILFSFSSSFSFFLAPSPSF